MHRKLIAAVALLAFAVAGNAAEVRGRLVKVDGDKITVLVGANKKKDVKGEEKTFTVAKDARFYTLTPTKKGEAPREEPLTEGLKAPVFSKTRAKGGPNVVLDADDKNVVTSVKVRAAKKKKDKQ